MDARFGLLLLFVLGASWACNARHLEVVEVVISDASVVQINQGPDEEVIEKVARNDKVCTLCEEFTVEAVEYLSQNKTQTEIVEMLHTSCSRIPTFKKQCITLVDYYSSLFFLEISSIQPQDFCTKFNLCQKVALISSRIRENSCGMCHHAVSEVLNKLQDPETKLDIIQLLLKGCNSMQNYEQKLDIIQLLLKGCNSMQNYEQKLDIIQLLLKGCNSMQNYEQKLDIIQLLLKGCNSMQNYEQKCKRMVFEYGPLILVNAEHFLQTTDVCTIVHACDGGKQALTADS